MAQTLLGDLGMHTRKQQLGRMAVSEVMKTHSRQIGQSPDQAGEIVS